ncbi:MAG: hypothetical protein HGB18_04525 [Candidatus Moranbacteria bacterium]|nr:hypothetical protein [Candidatus Moranbacteria bacterium]
MTDEKRIDGGGVPGLDLELAKEQQARVHLNIPVYADESDKRAGRMRPLTEEERWKVDEYLGRSHEKPSEAATEAIEGEDEHFKAKTYEELSDAIVEHGQRMQEAYEDMRGRIGIGEGGLVPGPGSEAERAVLDQVMEHVKGEIIRLNQEGRTSESDPAYVDISRAHESFKEYMRHRKAYLGLSAYRKEHFASREADQEKQRQERAKETDNAIRAAEVHTSILQRFVGKMR